MVPQRRVATEPTALLSLGGLALLTDPTFDQPGDYELPGGRTMTKLTGPAVEPADLGSIDAVLLSHDEHLDNLDRAGRALLPSVPVVLSTPGAAERIEGVTDELGLRRASRPDPQHSSTNRPRDDWQSCPV